MKTTITVIDFSEDLKKLALFAEENPLSMDDLLDMMNGALKNIGDTEGHFLLVDQLQIKIVHCIEHQVKAKVRYLSISFLGGKDLPPIEFVRQTAKALGFKKHLADCIIDFEEINGKKNVVSIREIIEE